MQGCILVPVQDFILPFVEHYEVPVSPLLQPIEVSLNGSTPLVCHLLTQLVAGLQMDFMPLIIALSAWQLIQRSVHLTVYLSSLHFVSLSMMMLWKAAVETL